MVLSGSAGKVLAAAPAHAQGSVKVGLPLTYPGQIADAAAQMDNGIQLYMRQKGFFFQAEDGIRDIGVTGVQTCALPISSRRSAQWCLDGVNRCWEQKQRFIKADEMAD